MCSNSTRLGRTYGHEVRPDALPALVFRGIVIIVKNHPPILVVA